MQQALGPHTAEHVLHPLLPTLGNFEILGGNFGPEKIKLAGIFNQKPTSPPSWHLRLPLPLPQAEIRGRVNREVHTVN